MSRGPALVDGRPRSQGGTIHVKLKGKVALVTGAGSGMGKATALLFASEGAKVAAADIREASVESVAREVQEAGGEAIAIGADVAKSEDVQRMVAATLERLRTT